MVVAYSSSTRSSTVNAPIDSFVYALTPQSMHILSGNRTPPRIMLRDLEHNARQGPVMG